MRSRIEYGLRLIALPNITNVFHGRNVGYKIDRIDLYQAQQDISASKERAKLAPPSAEARERGEP